MFNKIKNKGFTIIELLVVVLIIGVLAGIALPMYFNVLEKSRTSEPLQVLGQIARAEQRYKLQTLEYTNEADKLDITIKDYTSGQEVTNNEFDSEFFNFTLGTENATAQRKDGDYTLGVNYTTSQLSCTPAEHRVCKSLGLEEGAPAAFVPTCTTQERYGQVVNSCVYEDHQVDTERWCNGNAVQFVMSWNSNFSSSGSCAEGETIWEGESWVSTIKRCNTSGATSTECLPNTYNNTVIERERPMDDDLRAFVVGNSYYFTQPIYTYVNCVTDSTDGSCIRYNYMYEVSDAAPGGCDRYCNEIDETGFGCANWTTWYCDN